MTHVTLPSPDTFYGVDHGVDSRYAPSPTTARILPGVTLIALTGRPGVGKDACATVLTQRLGYRSIAFADLLRREVAQTWRIDERMLTHRPTKECDIPALAAGMCSEPGFMSWCLECEESLHAPRSARWALQNWASWRRRFDPDYFVTPVSRWIARQIGMSVKYFVVTDLRFANEFGMLKARGAKVIRVHRQETTGLADDTAFHESETGQRSIQADADIQNDASMHALAEAVLNCPVIAQQGSEP